MASPAERLRGVIDGFDAPLFVVVDGGHFEDLPAALGRAGLSARSLFLDSAEPEVERTGPWLVRLGEERRSSLTDALLSLVGDRSAAVFWRFDGAEAVLFRHLRTLYLVRIPKWAARGDAYPPAIGSATDEGHDAVMFRHWDPNVLGALTPTLDVAQFARLLGPAQEIAFVSGDHGGMRRMISSPDWPPPPTGPLTFRSDQIVELGRRRSSASQARTLNYLRDAAPDQTRGLSDAELHELIARSRRNGRDIGLSGDRAHAKWAYLMLMTDGGIASSPGIRPYLQNGAGHSDARMDKLMLSLIAARQRLGQV